MYAWQSVSLLKVTHNGTACDDSVCSPPLPWQLVIFLTTFCHSLHFHSPRTEYCSASYLMNTSLFPTRSHLSPNLAITISVSFAVSAHTSIPKQPPPSPLPLFTPSSDYCNSLYHNLPKCHITRLQRIQNSLARAVVKAPKFSHTTPILRSPHWLKITEHIEYKFLSLTY